jgi:hypothetical protein
MALHGLRLPVADVDLLLAPADAARLLQENGIPREADKGDGRFSSDVFGRWVDAPMPIDVMGGLHVLHESRWAAVLPTTRVAIELVSGTVFVPSIVELAAITRFLGRPKDVVRAKLLDALPEG